MIDHLRTWYRGVHGGISGERLPLLSRITRAFVFATPLVFLVLLLPARQVIASGFRSQPLLVAFAGGWLVVLTIVITLSKRWALNERVGKYVVILAGPLIWPVVAFAKGGTQLAVACVAAALLTGVALGAATAGRKGSSE